MRENVCVKEGERGWGVREIVCVRESVCVLERGGECVWEKKHSYQCATSSYTFWVRNLFICFLPFNLWEKEKPTRKFKTKPGWVGGCVCGGGGIGCVCVWLMLSVQSLSRSRGQLADTDQPLIWASRSLLVALNCLFLYLWTMVTTECPGTFEECLK